jgi:hypothetical protein
LAHHSLKHKIKGFTSCAFLKFELDKYLNDEVVEDEVAYPDKGLIFVCYL